ncbi:MAG: (Fe-S)-binding protein [Opitutales bacterium]|nr:(Fe-S)-binding protein [Opitutales bacterium]
MNAPKPKPSKEVDLMITCLCDTFYDQVAASTVKVLEHVGCTVQVPEAQTCCGQPAFNAGDWKAARKVIQHTLKAFSSERTVVIPSGSCNHMVQHGYPLAFEESDDLEDVISFAKRCWELADYLVNGLGVKKWPGKFDGKISLHRSCHTRGSDSYASAVQLLSSIEGLELLEFDESEQCCGFGGTFSVAYPNTSTSMGKLKIEKLTAVKPNYIGATDMACMLHMGGIASKEETPFKVMHIAQILDQALQTKEAIA